jgi:phage terminase Nu1 subunit (DNA packaging protein)
MAEKNSGNITDTTEVNTTELASILGITARRIQQMAQDGTLPTVRRGKFELCKSVQRYISFLGKNKLSEEDEKLEKVRRQSEVTLKASKAQIAKLEASELQGKMHRSEDVAAMTEDLIYTIRAALVALPGRLAVDVADTKTAAEASEVIRKEVYKTMKELSEYRYSPKKYEERVRDRQNWEKSESDIDDE